MQRSGKLALSQASRFAVTLQQRDVSAVAGLWETGTRNGAGDRQHEDPRSHLTLVATVNAAPAWVAYSSNIDHVQRPWVIAMSRSAANSNVWHCCSVVSVQAL